MKFFLPSTSFFHFIELLNKRTRSLYTKKDKHKPVYSHVSHNIFAIKIFKFGIIKFFFHSPLNFRCIFNFIKNHFFIHLTLFNMFALHVYRGAYTYKASYRSVYNSNTEWFSRHFNLLPECSVRSCLAFGSFHSYGSSWYVHGFYG